MVVGGNIYGRVVELKVYPDTGYECKDGEAAQMCETWHVDAADTRKSEQTVQKDSTRHNHCGRGEDELQHEVPVRHNGRRDALHPGAEDCRFQAPAQH